MLSVFQFINLFNSSFKLIKITITITINLTKMSGLTYISAIQISTYTTLDALKVDIVKTLARWFPNNYVYDEHNPLDSWAIREETEIDILCNGTFQFELLQVDIQHVYELTMYGVGRYRRHGSSCDFFERVFDGLEQQLKHPSPPFATMTEAITCKESEDCIDFGTPFQYTTSSALPFPGALAETVVYDKEDADEILLTTEDAAVLSDDEDSTVASLEDLDEDNADAEDDEDSDDESEAESLDSDDEDERIMSMPLRDMTDTQIDRYIDLSGRCPRDEIDEWTMNFRGGAILRYSYVNFSDTTLEDQHVSNVTIRRARFAGCTLRNFQFEQVHFDECNFLSVTLENVTFKDCQFTECDLDPYMSLDNSCSVENFDYDEEMRQAFLEDNVTYRYC